MRGDVKHTVITVIKTELENFVMKETDYEKLSMQMMRNIEKRI
jgi:hypothetical protein